jgi:UDP-N-acetylglucosamine/UDP-N-acetylgalactosamine diphosphorylase
MPDLAAVRASLQSIDQAHLLNFYGQLPPAQQESLLAQISALDLASIPALVKEYVLSKPGFAAPGEIRPPTYYPARADSPVRTYDQAKFRAIGEGLLRAGKVACFTVAGGQGTRLGYDGPKGCYPAGAVTNKPLFQVFAEGVLAAGRKYGKPVPWYIMTSPLNHAATVAFFESRGYFGLSKDQVRFFPQGVMPSFDLATGKVLLAAPGDVATNPDGHGGAVRALKVSGALAEMQARGIEQVSYFQVDNPLAKVVDPLFLGLHAGADDSSGEMSSKFVPKAGPEEKVGVFCSVGGRTEVVEYSDMPAALTQARNADGSLTYMAGSIAIHIISVEFLSRLASDAAFSLPYHRAEKKVPHVDLRTGQAVNPEKPNGVKLERFVFDALAMCGRGARKGGSILLETDRVEEFAPIKNATGVDSPETCRQIQTQRAARWLEAAGIRAPRRADGAVDAVLEISPLSALEPADLAPRVKGLALVPGVQVVL